MFDSILNSVSSTADVSISVSNTLISIGVALVLGFVISLSYLITTPKRERSASFIMSIIILPTIVAVVILLIGGNLARAFSMAGIFTIVRFRSIPGDSKDISYVFLTMSVGLAIGLGYITLGAAVAVIIGLAIIVIKKSGYGVTIQQEKRLRITVPEDMNYQDLFDDILKKYTEYCVMQRVKTINMGTLFEIAYDVILKKGMSEKEFIDELRCRNGNLTIQLGVKDNGYQQL